MERAAWWLMMNWVVGVLILCTVDQSARAALVVRYRANKGD